MNEISNLLNTISSRRGTKGRRPDLRRKPFEVVGKSGGRGLLGIEPEQEGGIKRRDLLRCRWRPKEGPSLNDVKRSQQVIRGATESAIIQIPSVNSLMDNVATRRAWAADANG